MSANDLLVEPSTQDNEQSKQQQAEAFLTKQLSTGPKATKYIEQEATALGIRERTLDNARKSLSITTEKRGNVWWMKWPEERKPETEPKPLASLRPCTLDEEIQEYMSTIKDSQEGWTEQEECKDARAQGRSSLFTDDYEAMDDNEEAA